MKSKLINNGTFAEIEVTVDEVKTFVPANYLVIKPGTKQHYKFYEDRLENNKLVVDMEQENIQIQKENNKFMKDYIEKAVGCSRVEVKQDTKVLGFDADEKAQGRLGNAKEFMQNNPNTQYIPWKLYDNTDDMINIQTVTEAKDKAVTLMSTLWFCQTKEQVDNIVKQDTIWARVFFGLDTINYDDTIGQE